MRTLRTVLDLAQKRDFGAAAAIAERTLAEGFEHPMLLNVAATRREQLGRHDEALKLLERAVTIAPNDIGARNALGLCLMQLDRPAQARVHFDHLAERHPELAFAHGNRGNALMALGLPGRAEPSHRQAVQLDPSNFVSLAGLASIAVHRGQFSEAREWAQRALELTPGFPEALLSLAAIELAGGELDAAERRLRQLILDSRTGKADRARAAGLLGDVLDAGRRHGEAFEAYEMGNAALQQIHQRFADEHVLAYTRSITAAAEKVDAARWRERRDLLPSGAAGHVFLLGFPRTGTTLVEVTLEGSEQVVGLEEYELLSDGVMQFMRAPVDFEALVSADGAALAAQRSAYWRRVREAGIDPAGKIFIDKHPLNTLKLPLIAKLFPDAKILFAVRDPRDVVFSCYRRRFQMNPSMYEFLSLSGTAEFYAAAMNLAAVTREAANLAWHEVRYERLLENFDAEMQGICRFIGLDWSASLREFGPRVNLRERSTPSTAQLSKGLSASAQSHWRHYAEPMARVRPTLAPWVESFGYSED